MASDASLSDSNAVYFADDTNVEETYGKWFDDEVALRQRRGSAAGVEGGGGGGEEASAASVDLEGFRAICVRQDIIRRSVGFGPGYRHRMEEEQEEREIRRQFSHHRNGGGDGGEAVGAGGLETEAQAEAGIVKRDAFVAFCRTTLGASNRVALKFMEDEVRRVFVSQSLAHSLTHSHLFFISLSNHMSRRNELYYFLHICFII